MNGLTRRQFISAAGAGLTLLAADRRLCATETDSGPTEAGRAGLSEKGAFFHVTEVDGGWWIIDPQGRRFISKGVTTVQFAQDYIQGTRTSPYGQTNKTKYSSQEAWREAAATRLIGWGFNTLGAWSDERLAGVAVDGRHLGYAPTLDLGAQFVARKGKGQAWLQGVFPDVFDPEFETTARKTAAERCGAHKDDPRLLGWFTDNELRWGPDWRGSDELLTMFLALPADAPGHAAAIGLLRERYATIAKFNDVWKTGFESWDQADKAGAIKPPLVRKEVYNQNQEVERKANEVDPARAAFVGDCEAFLERLAERYFHITQEAIRAADANHMIFGCRFAYVPARPVVNAAAKFLDAISFNCYQADPRGVIRQYSALGKPLIIGEFSFRGEDSGLPNTKGAGPKVKTQAGRAAAFAQYVRLALSDPHVVGYHWFEHADEPKEGRFDGENSNYGLVNIRDEPYEALTRKMAEVNAVAELWHADKPPP
jgi:agarase